MEFIKSPFNFKIEKLSEFILLFFYFTCVFLPLSVTLLKYAVSIDVELLSPTFFLLLARATFFALLQASLSILLIGLCIFLVSSIQLFFPAGYYSRKFFEIIGLLSFSLSPTIVALTLLMSFGLSFGELPSGLGAIVFCHFLINFAFFSSVFLRRLDRFLFRQGNDLLLLLKSLGSRKRTTLAEILWPVFSLDLRSWGPQVFLWCFMSFAPVVLLSSGPQQNTPELLLYYSLLNDPSGSRMLIIFLLTAAISYFLNRYFIGRSLSAPKLHEESQSADQNFGIKKRGTFLLWVLSIMLILPFLYSLLSPVFSIGAGHPPTEFGEIQASLLPTLCVFLATLFLCFLFSLLTLLCTKELRLISYCNFISAPMILVGSFSLLTRLQGSISYLVIAAGSFLAIFPWLHHQLRVSVERLPQELKLLSLTLGMDGLSYFKNFLWPQLRSSVVHFSILISLWSLGEYTFSKALLNRNSTLALLIEEKLRRYQFADASVAMSLTLLTSVVVVAPLLWKGKRRVAV
jgi:ABC-type Fe3+ transport system permease subunit